MNTVLPPKLQIPQDLMPGDILGYKGMAIVRWKTDGKAGHVAVYIGDGQCVTALTNGGVGIYPLSVQGDLVWVRRPSGSFNLQTALDWFARVDGKKYGWDDIAGVAGLHQIQQGNDDQMDCSDTSSSFLEAGNAAQFDPAYDHEAITPRDFETTALSVEIWSC